MRAWSMMMALLALAPGCTTKPDESSDDVMETEVALVQGNHLAANALALNALALNGIALNGIALNTLDPDSLAAIQDSGSSGTLARAFLKYAISCAFNPWQSFSFTWTESTGDDDDDDEVIVHEETYRGDIGLAPGWATGPLDVQGQRMVTACLAARVNYYEVPVTISMRSITEPLQSLTGSEEINAFPRIEGAFWGNLWASTPFVKACHDNANVANSRAWQRDCAAGHLRSDGTLEECGIIDIVGSCASVCQTLSGTGQYYPSCFERPGQSTTTTKYVITTALP